MLQFRHAGVKNFANALALVEVEYDDATTTLEAIQQAVQAKGYPLA